jgi:hypothetical protein
MELVRGRTFRALIGQPVSIDSLRDLGSQIAKALATAHAAGIVHRDIKPENLMVRDDGYVKVLDFGVARLKPLGSETSTFQSALDSVNRTVVGTLRYMSPEQASSSAVDAATDVFSLGLVLYELATGQHPFEANTAFGVLDAILSKTPAPPGRLNPRLPAEINALILRMLDKDFWKRPDAGEVAAVLTAVPEHRHPALAVRVAPDRRTVGREAERAALRTAFEQAAGGRGLMVCIAGEPGIGRARWRRIFLRGERPVWPASSPRRLLGTARRHGSVSPGPRRVTQPAERSGWLHDRRSPADDGAAVARADGSTRLD